MRRGDAESWGDEHFCGPAQLGLLTWGAVGHSEFMWRARTEPRLCAAFETAWGLEGGAPLLTSFDGAALFRPPQLQPAWATRPALEWLHVDQGAGKRGMVALQGQLLLWDQDAASGGLCVVPRSHLLHDELVPAVMGNHDYVQFDANDPRLGGLGDARVVCAQAGDLILWDSRTVHASSPADPAAPLLTEKPTEDEGGGGSGPPRPRPTRAVAFICMVPAAAHLENHAQLAAQRAELVARACTTTHWPFETRMVSQGAEGSGVGNSAAGLSPAARALVAGTPCEVRRRWRAAQPAAQPAAQAG